MPKLEGAVYPVFQIVVLILLVAAPAFIHFTEPEGGPGAKHAAILISLAAGVIVGILAQRTRLCMVGGIRDAVLFGEYKLLFGFVAILVSALLMNVALGFSTQDLSDSQSHTQTDCGMHLACIWPGLAAFFLEVVRCVS